MPGKGHCSELFAYIPCKCSVGRYRIYKNVTRQSSEGSGPSLQALVRFSNTTIILSSHSSVYIEFDSNSNIFQSLLPKSHTFSFFTCHPTQSRLSRSLFPLLSLSPRSPSLSFLSLSLSLFFKHLQFLLHPLNLSASSLHRSSSPGRLVYVHQHYCAICENCHRHEVCVVFRPHLRFSFASLQRQC